MKRKLLFWSSILLIAVTTLACSTSLLTQNQTGNPSITSTQVQNENDSPQAVIPQVESSLPNAISSDTIANLYEIVNPGVVAIRVLSAEGGGLGSGFVFDEEGHIVTNYHVVQDSEDLEVDFPSGYKTRAEVLGTDPDSDIAILKVNAPTSELHPIPLGDSDKLKVGEFVIAIGNPRGLSSTITIGVVSGKGRTLSSLHEAPGGGSFTAGDIIQTDAAINPGNSGGPLLNLSGEVIGVNVAIQTNSYDLFGQPINSGIGFAVPINIVKRVAPALIENGKYDYPYLGIRSTDEITLFEQEALGLSQSTGVYVIDVTPDSPADKAGLKGGDTPTDVPGLVAGGDLIIAIDDTPVRDFNDLITYLIHHKQPGDVVTLTVLRNGQEIKLDLTLGRRP